jgi:hypothetical protein
MFPKNNQFNQGHDNNKSTQYLSTIEPIQTT